MVVGPGKGSRSGALEELSENMKTVGRFGPRKATKGPGKWRRYWQCFDTNKCEGRQTELAK